MADQQLYIYIILLSLLFSAIFSGVEIAFISADKLKVELKSQAGSVWANIISGFMKKPSWFISTTLIGNNVSLVVYGIFMALLLKPYILHVLPDAVTSQLSILIVQTIISTALVLIVAEYLPKSLFLINPSFMLSIFAIPIKIIYTVLYPAVFVIVHLSRFVIEKILGYPYSEDQPVYNLTDLNQYVLSMHNFLQEEAEIEPEVDTKFLSNALEFKKAKVRDCMVPRTELVTVDVEESIDELKKAFVESGYSKILVYRESIDHIIGYCNSIDLFKKPKDIESILAPITIVPETMLANEVMVQFISDRKSIALVVDEFGGTSGIVTIEDIIEEIFGDIQDEHDDEDLIEEVIDEQTYILSARLEIDYLKDKYNWELPVGDYDTLGGLILSITEDIPSKNEIVECKPYLFTILSIDNKRIHTVKLTILT